MEVGSKSCASFAVRGRGVRTRYQVTFLVSAILSAAIPAKSAETLAAADFALFDAFRTFCVDTGARPEAVKAAVESAGADRAECPVQQTFLCL